jgi:hypothetical protein
MKYKRDYLGGAVLNLVGNLAAKAVTSAIKSGTAGQLAKQVGNNLLKDVSKQAVGMAHSHVDNLAKSVYEKTGVKVDTTDMKQLISNQAGNIKNRQYGGSDSISQYGAGLPLAMAGKLAGQFVHNVAKSKVANELTKQVKSNAQSLVKNIAADAKTQAIQIAHSHIDNLAGEIHKQSGLKIDTSDLKNNVTKRTSSLF